MENSIIIVNKKITRDLIGRPKVLNFLIVKDLFVFFKRELSYALNERSYLNKELIINDDQLTGVIMD